MNPSDQLILDCFNSKLYHLYNYPVTSKAVKDGQGVVDVPRMCRFITTLSRECKPWDAPHANGIGF